MTAISHLLAEARARIERLLDGVQPYYASAYANEEVGYWGDLPERIHKEIRSRNDNGEVPKILDIGCAYGTLLEFCDLSGECHCHGFDVYRYDNGMNPRIETYDYISGPIPPGWDIILCTEVIEHLPFSPAALLAKIREALNDRGILFLSTPASETATWGKLGPPLFEMRQQSPSDVGDGAAEHFKLYQQKELLDLLVGVGFSSIFVARSASDHYSVWARR